MENKQGRDSKAKTLNHFKLLMIRFVRFLILHYIMLIRQDSREGLIEHEQSNTHHQLPPKQTKEAIKGNPDQQPQKEEAISKQQQKGKSKRKRSTLSYILKTLNLIVGGAFIAFAIYCYSHGFDQGLAANATTLIYVMPAYIGLSGLVIMCIECRVGVVVRNLRFFYNYFGRGVFNLYAGVMPLTLISNFKHTLSTFQIITIVAAAVMCLVGVLYIGMKVCCCEKEGDKINQKSSDEDDE